MLAGADGVSALRPKFQVSFLNVGMNEEKEGKKQALREVDFT